MLALAALLPAATLCAAAAHTPPHILHIMADDTGWNDLGYKNKLVNSPNIDRLAMEGIRFTRNHAFKVCSPTRASFHTGRYGHSMGLYDNSNAAVPWTKVIDQAVPLNFTLLPELLSKKGYVTHGVGKWHLGYPTKAYTPTERGYDTFYGYYNAMTADYWTHSHSVGGPCPLSLDLHNSSKGWGIKAGTDNGTYEATLFGDRAVDIIGAHDVSQPMFMYLAFHNEHDPHQAPRSALSEEKVGHIKNDVYKVTAALIETMDEQVGRVLGTLSQKAMLDNVVIGFQSDNGGPLDHANNWPFRGGKHTFWEGGVRTEAFVWSPLFPKARQGTEWHGLAHVSDWFYTYSVGVAGVPLADAQNAGPFADDARNLWSALMAPDAATPSPRTEVAHMVHSPAHYPGNCSMECWGSRNCPEVLTVGEMKLAIGYIGDYRILPIEFHAGVDSNGSATPVPWGLSGGSCDVKPPETMVAGETAPDPNCATGIVSKIDKVTCCAKSCGTCGGKDCGANPGGKDKCCRGDIDRSGKSCSVVGPPCKMDGGPAPAPGPFADRCTSTKMSGTPKPDANHACAHGCLFNLTADPTESNNLFNDTAYAATIASMKARLKVLGDAAPRWAWVPEVQHMTKAQFGQAKCDAAKKLGAVAPIDI